MSPLKKVERATRKADVARHAADEAIRDAHEAGFGLRPIALAAGISHEQVRRIVQQVAA